MLYTCVYTSILYHKYVIVYLQSIIIRILSLHFMRYVTLDSNFTLYSATPEIDVTHTHIWKCVLLLYYQFEYLFFLCQKYTFVTNMLCMFGSVLNSRGLLIAFRFQIKIIFRKSILFIYMLLGPCSRYQLNFLCGKNMSFILHIQVHKCVYNCLPAI